jgi:hypothetical protein
MSVHRGWQPRIIAGGRSFCQPRPTVHLPESYKALGAVRNVRTCPVRQHRCVVRASGQGKERPIAHPSFGTYPGRKGRCPGERHGAIRTATLAISAVVRGSGSCAFLSIHAAPRQSDAAGRYPRRDINGRTHDHPRGMVRKLIRRDRPQAYRKRSSSFAVIVWRVSKKSAQGSALSAFRRFGTFDTLK